MTAVCRCFARGKIQNAAKSTAQGGEDNILILPEPYIARESLTATTGSAVTSAAALATAATKLLQVQVQGGKTVHYRITGTGTAVEADTSDPTITGENLFSWGIAHSISFLEYTA